MKTPHKNRCLACFCVAVFGLCLVSSGPLNAAPPAGAEAPGAVRAAIGPHHRVLHKTGDAAGAQAQAGTGEELRSS